MKRAALVILLALGPFGCAMDNGLVKADINDLKRETYELKRQIASMKGEMSGQEQRITQLESAARNARGTKPKH